MRNRYNEVLDQVCVAAYKGSLVIKHYAKWIGWHTRLWKP